jgi:hypothetical protein
MIVFEDRFRDNLEYAIAGDDVMKRRDFLLHLSSVVPAASILGAAFRSDRAEAALLEPSLPGSGWRTFQIDTTVEITEPTHVSQRGDGRRPAR